MLEIFHFDKISCSCFKLYVLTYVKTRKKEPLSIPFVL